MEQAIYDIPKLRLVVIDGTRDMVYDINSPSESTRIISKLMQWTDDRQIHIHTILHQNKGDENARGHIDAELNNKTETVLLVEKNKNDCNISRVSAMHIRAMDFELFAFCTNDKTLPGHVHRRERPEDRREPFDAYKHITEQQHRITLEADNSSLHNKIMAHKESIGDLQASLRRQQAQHGKELATVQADYLQNWKGSGRHTCKSGRNAYVAGSLFSPTRCSWSGTAVRQASQSIRRIGFSRSSRWSTVGTFTPRNTIEAFP